MREALAFLRERPYENVFLQYMLEYDPHTILAEKTFFVHRAASGAIGAAVHFGSNTVLAGADPAAAAALAERSRRMAEVRMIVGPSALVAPYWEAVRPWHRVPRLVRERQPLLMVQRSTLRGTRAAAAVRRAMPADAATVAAHSARMIAGELGYDPRETRASFAAGVGRIIDRGWWWVLIHGGALQFMCNIGSATAQTAQIQGVWTPPELRGQGVATRAFGAICDHLLDHVPTLSLYVNDFNEPALALYRRAGFASVGELRTLLFG